MDTEVCPEKPVQIIGKMKNNGEKAVCTWKAKIKKSALPNYGESTLTVLSILY